MSVLDCHPAQDSRRRNVPVHSPRSAAAATAFTSGWPRRTPHDSERDGRLTRAARRSLPASAGPRRRRLAQACCLETRHLAIATRSCGHRPAPGIPAALRQLCRTASAPMHRAATMPPPDSRVSRRQAAQSGRVCAGMAIMTAKDTARSNRAPTVASQQRQLLAAGASLRPAVCPPASSRQSPPHVQQRQDGDGTFARHCVPSRASTGASRGRPFFVALA